MPFQIIRGDITHMKVDAIVNAANSTLLGGGGVDGAIHRAAGPKLLAECRRIGGCPTGEARITKGYQLPCHYVIHTVGPVWMGGLSGEGRALAACYRSALQLAQQYNCKSVAFPLIASGAYGYPYEQAKQTAMNAIRRFLMENDNDMCIYLVLYDAPRVSDQRRLEQVQRFLEAHYQPALRHGYQVWESAAASAPPPSARVANNRLSLKEMLDSIDESFSDMVKRKICEKGLTNAECYKRANIDKKLFSKINNDAHYKPKKPTAVALAIALELDMNETRELLMKAGYALNRSEPFDIIIEYFITMQQYDLFEINEVLFDYDQPLLGNMLL